MAHFAELDENNKVIQVLVVSNDITTVDGVENEQLGIDFLNDLFQSVSIDKSSMQVFTSCKEKVDMDVI